MLEWATAAQSKSLCGYDPAKLKQMVQQADKA